LVCDLARNGNATLRFACGCALRLEAVPGEFEEHMAYDGYEGCEFDTPERKEAAFVSTATAEFLLCESHRATFDNPPENELLDLQLDYVERYYNLESPTTLRAALFFRRALRGDGADERVALEKNFHNLAEFLAAKKREKWTGYAQLVDEARRVFPDFQGVETVKTKFGEETVVDFLGAEPVDLCGIRPRELAFLAFLASVIDMRRTASKKSNYAFYPDVDRYFSPGPKERRRPRRLRYSSNKSSSLISTIRKPTFGRVVAVWERSKKTVTPSGTTCLANLRSVVRATKSQCSSKTSKR